MNHSLPTMTNKPAVRIDGKRIRIRTDRVDRFHIAFSVSLVSVTSIDTPAIVQVLQCDSRCSDIENESRSSIQKRAEYSYLSLKPGEYWQCRIVMIGHVTADCIKVLLRQKPLEVTGWLVDWLIDFAVKSKNGKVVD